jgi:glycosyltransferase involved in cell wall biosynthesis
MKIAFVNQPIGGAIRPKGHCSSIAIIIYELARRLAASHEVTVYDRRGPDQSETETLEGVRFRRLSPEFKDDVPFRVVRKFGRFPDPRRPLFASGWYHRGYIHRIARDLRSQDCEVVLVANMLQYPAIIRRLNPGIRVVLDMQCEWLNQLDRRLVSGHLEHVDLILGCSDFITRKARAALPEHAALCHTLLNGYDAERFQPASLAVSGTKRLLFMGRLTPEKGVHVLIDAFQRIADGFPQAELDIVGPEDVTPRSFVVAISDNPATRDLERWHGRSYLAALKQAVPRSLAGRVHFVGSVPHEQTASYYRRSYAYVHPAVWDEPMAMPLFEATASGLPVIATRTGGTPEVVLHGKTGLLVAANDTEALASAIGQLLSDPGLRTKMSRAGGQWAVSNLSWDRVAERLSNYLHEVSPCAVSTFVPR